MLIHLNPANAEVHLLRSSFKSLCFTETSRVQPELQVSWLLHRQKISLDEQPSVKGQMISQHSEYHSFVGRHIERGPGKKYVQEDVCCAMLSRQPCLTLWDPVYCSLPGLVHWDFPGKNTGVGFHALLQSIFLTQRLNSGLLHCR